MLVAVRPCAVRAEAVGVGTCGIGGDFLCVPGAAIGGCIKICAITRTICLHRCIVTMRTCRTGRTAMAVASCAAGRCTVAVGTGTAGAATMAMTRHFGSSLGVGGAAAGGAHRVGAGNANDKLTFDALPCAADKACWAGGVVAGPEFDSGVILRTLSGKGFFDTALPPPHPPVRSSMLKVYLSPPWPRPPRRLVGGFLMFGRVALRRRRCRFGLFPPRWPDRMLPWHFPPRRSGSSSCGSGTGRGGGAASGIELPTQGSGLFVRLGVGLRLCRCGLASAPASLAAALAVSSSALMRSLAAASSFFGGSTGHTVPHDAAERLVQPGVESSPSRCWWSLPGG